MNRWVFCQTCLVAVNLVAATKADDSYWINLSVAVGCGVAGLFMWKVK